MKACNMFHVKELQKGMRELKATNTFTIPRGGMVHTECKWGREYAYTNNKEVKGMNWRISGSYFILEGGDGRSVNTYIGNNEFSIDGKGFLDKVSLQCLRAIKGSCSISIEDNKLVIREYIGRSGIAKMSFIIHPYIETEEEMS